METSRRARTLRPNATSTERKVWGLLRGRRLSRLKFRRQVPIGPYVADFVCLRHRLIVEADGPFHSPEEDAARDGWLREQGFGALRFTNGQLNAPDQVLGAILAAVEAPSVAI